MGAITGQRKVGQMVTREAVTMGVGQGEATQMAAEAVWAAEAEREVLHAHADEGSRQVHARSDRTGPGCGIMTYRW